MERDSEAIIRLARVPEGRAWDVVSVGDPQDRTPPSMAVISLCRVPMSRDPTYALHFLSAAGHCLAYVQCETMRAALDTAHQYAGLEDEEWTTCRIAVPDDGEFDLHTLESHLPDE